MAHTPASTQYLPLVVVGAHLSGGPLNHELTAGGALLAGPVRTAACYRLYALSTEPAKPGLVRVLSGGHHIEGEKWLLPPTALGSFLAALPAPMALGRLSLEDGSTCTGFLCEPYALTEALDITHHGGWRAYLSALRSAL
jgi:allophanate hydrolase